MSAVVSGTQSGTLPSDEADLMFQGQRDWYCLPLFQGHRVELCQVRGGQGGSSCQAICTICTAQGKASENSFHSSRETGRQETCQST